MDISPPRPQPSTTITTTVTTAATTVKTPDPESEPPKQPIPPPFTNGVLKRHKPFNHHHQPLSPPVVVTYKECLKNHAATMGGHAVDGCGEFMPSPSSSPSLPTSLKCAACGCHRNFHRREHDHFQPPSPPPMQHLLEYQPQNRHQPPPPPQPPLTTTTTSPLNSPSSPPPISSSYYPSSAPHMLLALGSETNHYSTTPMSGKKRFRTKFTQAQKDKMHEIASKVGWKMQKRDEEMINSFCNEIGVDRNVFKVWMHNNKSTNKNINNENNNLGHGHASSNNIINVNNINGHDAIDFIMSRNINNNNNGSSHNDDVIHGSNKNSNNNNNNNHDLHLVSGNVIKGSSSSC